MKSTDDNIFGGYTDLNLNPNGAWVRGNKNSFLFALSENKAIKCRCINDKYEISTDNKFLIYFGLDSLCIDNDCNINKNSYCEELGEYFEQSSLPTKYLAGKNHFQVKELEIF